MSNTDIAGNIAIAIAVVVAALVYFIPTIVAFRRGHAYRWVIFVLNVAGGWTGVAWVAAMIWAVWPAEKSLTDPVLGNVTGTGSRNVGDTLGAVDYGRERGYASEKLRSEPAAPKISS